jgi:hypothetical protein
MKSANGKDNKSERDPLVLPVPISTQPEMICDHAAWGNYVENLPDIVWRIENHRFKKI